MLFRFGAQHISEAYRGQVAWGRPLQSEGCKEQMVVHCSTGETLLP